MKKIFTLILSSISLFSFSQVVPIEWTRDYNGPADNDDQAADMVIDAAGNVYVTGTSFGVNGTYDIATVKYNTAGTQQWSVAYNGVGNNNDQGAAVAVDAAGNVYVVGSAKSVSNLEDIVTIKYNSAGVQQWAKTYNGSGNGIDNGRDVAVDAAGNVYSTGIVTSSTTYTDWMTIQYDASGNQGWTATYHGTATGNDDANKIMLDGIGNVYVLGTSNMTATLSDVTLIKYDTTNGSPVWTKYYDSGTSQADFGNAMTKDAAGNILVAGQSGIPGNWFDFITIKYDAAGNQQWATRYNFGNNKYENPFGIITDLNNNVYVTGMGVGTGNNTQLSDIVTIKYDPTGTQQWLARYTSVGNNDDRGYSIGLDDTLNVYVTGYVSLSTLNRDYMTLKYDMNGVQKWTVSYDGAGNGVDEAHILAVGASAEVYVCGFSDVTPGSATNNNYTTIKYATSNIGFANYQETISDIILYPNPSTGNSTISITSEFLNENSKLFISVYDVAGREVVSQKEFQSNNKFANFDLSTIDLSKGMYVIKVNDDTHEFNGVGRLIIQ